MPRRDKWKKIDKIVRAEDGLGLCRFCRHCDKSNLPEQIGLGTEDYYRALCSATLKPCCTTRRSLITCSYFKSQLNSKKIPFFIRLIISFCEMDGTLLRSSHRRWSNYKEQE